MSKELEPTGQSESITVSLINPALMPGWFWLPTAHKLKESGYDYVIPNLPRDEPDATVEDNIDIIEDSLEESPRQYLVALSRGIEFTVRYIDRVAQKDSINKVIGFMVISSVGPRGYRSAQSDSGIPQQRHTPEYMKGIQLDDEGLESIDPAIALEVLLHDIQDEKLRQQTLTDLRANRPLTSAEVRSVPHLAQGLLPTSWYIGQNDRVDNAVLSAQIARDEFGVEPKYTDWGHLGPLTHTEEVSQAIIKEIETSVLTNKGAV